MKYLFLICIFLSGCCLIPIEIYENDAKEAWRLSFLQDHFGDVDIINGVYWNSGHWSGEFSYCFKISPNPSFVEEFIKAKKLKEDESFNLNYIRSDDLYPFPTWFAPDGRTYKVWSRNSLVLLVDQNTNIIYIHTTQL